MENRWVSVAEVAEHLGVRRESVYRWVNEGKIPGSKIGRLWKFKLEQVDAWVETGGAAKEPESTKRKMGGGNK